MARVDRGAGGKRADGARVRGSAWLAPSTLFWWRSKLRRGHRADDAQLVPVEVLDAAADRSTAIELVIHDGILLRLPRGFDEADLRRVLAAVGKPC